METSDCLMKTSDYLQFFLFTARSTLYWFFVTTGVNVAAAGWALRDSGGDSNSWFDYRFIGRIFVLCNVFNALVFIIGVPCWYCYFSSDIPIDAKGRAFLEANLNCWIAVSVGMGIIFLVLVYAWCHGIGKVTKAKRAALQNDV